MVCSARIRFTPALKAMAPTLPMCCMAIFVLTSTEEHAVSTLTAGPAHTEESVSYTMPLMVRSEKCGFDKVLKLSLIMIMFAFCIFPSL